MSEYQNNAIFWVETMKIKPNPYQPRREFEPGALEDLADSIRQYGVLQPLVVTRKETLRPESGGMDVHYELIAGERRLRAAKIAGLQQVPVIIRKETDDKVKLELAIIENLQREDLNPIDRALAFEQLHKQFNLTHVEIGKRMGKSRVYVSNSLRLLSLPEEIKKGLMEGRISEGHTRPLLMLSDRPDEQSTLYKEIMVKKMSVRDAEKVARKIAQDKVRKKEFIVDPKIRKYEKQLSENLGTRVHIEPKEQGGQITIDYFTLKDLEQILSSMKSVERQETMMANFLSSTSKDKDTSEFSFLTGNNQESTSKNENNELPVEKDVPQEINQEKTENTNNSESGEIQNQFKQKESLSQQEIITPTEDKSSILDNKEVSDTSTVITSTEVSLQDEISQLVEEKPAEVDNYTEPIHEKDLAMPDRTSNNKDPHISFDDVNSNRAPEYERKSFDDAVNLDSDKKSMLGDRMGNLQNDVSNELHQGNNQQYETAAYDVNSQPNIQNSEMPERNSHENVLPNNEEFLQNAQAPIHTTTQQRGFDSGVQNNSIPQSQTTQQNQTQGGYFKDGAYYQEKPQKKKGFFGKLFG